MKWPSHREGMKRQSICPKTQFVFWSTPNENTSSVITQTWMKASLLMDLLYVINHVEKNAAITNTSSGFDFGWKTFLCVLLKILQDQKLNRLGNRVLVTVLLCSCAGTSGLTHTMQQWLFDVINCVVSLHVIYEQPTSLHYKDVSIL